MKKHGKLLLIVCLAWWWGHGLAYAQTNASDWTRPLDLFETTGRASEPELVVDAAGVVHVFWAYGSPENEADGAMQSLYYTRQQQGVWSEPADVLVSPGERVARMPAVALDQHGYLHLAWSGGDSIYYSRAYAAEAAAPQAWTEPVAFTLYVAAFEPHVVAAADNVYLLWTEAGNGLVFAHSADGGQHWTSPQTIFAAPGAQELARWGRLAIDDAGRLHVALSLVRSNDLTAARNDPIYIYYLRSEDGGSVWTDPWLITPEPDFGEANVVAWGADAIHLLWNGRAGQHGRYHRWSSDGGKTWGPITEIISPRHPLGTGGLTGFPAAAFDARGDLHLVSTADPQNYYLRWHEGIWTEPVIISVGLTGAGVTGESPNMEQPSLALGLDNQLHVVFHGGQERIWYTSHLLPDLPALPWQPLPSLTPTEVVEPTASPPPLAVATPILTFSHAAPPPPASPYLGLALALLSAGTFLTLTLFIYTRARRAP